MRLARLTPVAILALALALAGCGGGDDSTSTAAIPGPSADANLRARYCAYDSTSHAEIVGCFKKTTPEQVTQFDTNPSKYAKGEIGCLKDSGPFCQ